MLGRLLALAGAASIGCSGRASTTGLFAGVGGDGAASGGDESKAVSSASVTGGSGGAGPTGGAGGASAASTSGTGGATSGATGGATTSSAGAGPSAAVSSSSSAATSGASSTAASSTGSGPAPSDGFDAFQHRNLDDVNQYRATLGLGALVLDPTLCDFALAGSQELSMDHTPHQHFINAGNNGTIWQSGFKSSAGENQGDPNGWYALSQDPVISEMAQIDAIQKAMFDEGPGTGEAHGHYENMMNGTFTRLGVGLLEIGGKLYLTNDFSD